MDQQAFLKQAFSLQRYLINRLCQRGVRVVDAESIVLEVISDISLRADLLPELNERGFQSYMVRACRNRMIDTFKRRPYREAERNREIGLGLSCPQPTPMSREVSQERCDAIREAAATSGPHAQAVLYMLEHGFSQIEIAEQLKLTGGRISQLVASIRERVSKRLPALMG